MFSLEVDRIASRLFIPNEQRVVREFQVSDEDPLEDGFRVVTSRNALRRVGVQKKKKDRTVESRPGPFSGFMERYTPNYLPKTFST